MAARKPSVTGLAAGGAPSSSVVPVGAKRSTIELDKMKYDLLQGIPKQAIVSMTNANGGEVYEGQVDGKNKRSGKGTLKWPNGNAYFGHWQDSSMCGQGIFLYAVENDVYRGEFKDDKKHGQGKYEFSNGNFYEGSFAVDKRHGRGRYSWTCGDSYDGEWCEGHMQGTGTTIYSNGNRYDGAFVADRREGRGTLVCADGLSYNGEWVKNMRHGTGRLQFPNGDYYEGSWDNDKKHGHGTDSFVNGNKFVGQYRDNVKHGTGVMTYANGDKYAGEWKGDKMDGQGRYDFSNGFVYEGSWAADVRHGMGRYTFPSGHVYVGEWKADKRHGSGQLTLAPSGDVYKGTWTDGKMNGRFVVERHNDWKSSTAAQQQPLAPSASANVVAFGGPMRKVYEGLWEQGVPTKSGVFYVYDSPSATEHALTLNGEWDVSQASKKSDGTIETPGEDHWRAVGLLTQLSTVGKKPGHLLSVVDNVFSGMSGRPLLDFYDAELQSYMPNSSMENERLLRLRRYADLIPRLEASVQTLEADVAKHGKHGDDATSQEGICQSVMDAEREAANCRDRAVALEADVQAADADTLRLQEEGKAMKVNIDAVAKQKEDLKAAKSNVSKLEAQVAAAAKEITALKVKRDGLQNDDVPGAETEVQTLRSEIDGALTSERAVKSATLSDVKRELSDKEAVLKSATKLANDGAAKAREAKQVLDAQIQKLNAQIAVASKQLTEGEKQRAQKLKKVTDVVKKKQEQEQAQLEQSRLELLRLQKLLESSQAALATLTEANDAQSARAVDEQTSVAPLEAEVKRWRDENRQQSNVLHEADASIQRLQEELVEARREELRRREASEAAAKQRQQQELGALQSKQQQQETALGIIQSEVDGLLAQCVETTVKRDALLADLEAIRAFAAAAGSPKKKRSTAQSPSKAARKASVSAAPCDGDETVALTSPTPPVAGRLRRGSSMLVQQAREDSPLDEHTRIDTESVGELEKRLATIQAQVDSDEVQVERLLREKKRLEDDIKALNDGFTTKAVQQAAGMFSANHAVNVSLDLNEAGKEAVRHQLIKARSKQSTLLKEQDRMHRQIAAAEEQLRDLRRQESEGSQQSIATIIASLRPEDWRLTYLVEQIDAKQKQIVELEMQCTNIPLLEEQLQSYKETLATLQNRQQQSSGLGVSSRRPPPF